MTVGKKEVVRFQRVLHVRAVERDITRSELAERMTEEGAIMGRINETENMRDDAVETFCAPSAEAVSPQELWFARQSIDMMERKLAGDRHELETCRDKIEETKAELLTRHQNVQLMARYVGRLEEKADKAALDAEQKNLDDIASMRFKRDTRGGASV
ncbi:MAG: flagellar FliJ family protein [Synergistaceae bacterium]|jgi:flagellar export protein FliJ|nr:flagellar FliJ family protein [Synergistaceae bacterium]